MPRCSAIAILTLCLSTGCASWRQLTEPSPPTPDRETRAADAIRQFEEHRDAAQYQAALDRCRQGDFARAEAMLTALVARQPNQHDARLRLAEILSARDDAAAESHFQAVLSVQPDHAEAHHAFGLFLDAAGRLDEARQHFIKAAQLEPENQIFQTTLTAKN
jgi:Tfp pilus assembly protein PilF